MDRRCFLRFLSALPGLAFLAATPEASPKAGSELAEKGGGEGVWFDGEKWRPVESGGVRIVRGEIPEEDVSAAAKEIADEIDRTIFDDWYATDFRLSPRELKWSEEEILAHEDGYRARVQEVGDLDSMGMGFSGSRDW